MNTMEASKETNGAIPTLAPPTPKMKKLAALLLMLDTDNAACIMKQLDEAELEAVSAEMAALTTITQDLQKEVLLEFSGVAVDAATSVSGGVDRAKHLLEKSVGLFRASDIVCRVTPSRNTVAAMQQIVDMDARHIFNLLRHEQLQTVALVTSYLPPEKASQLLSLLRPEMREQVLERLAMLAPTSIEVVENVAEALQKKFGNNRTRALNQTGGVKVAAQVLNALPKNVSQAILMSLRERNSELGDAVLKKMFTFEDLGRLDPRTLQRIMQVVNMSTLAVSLKTTGEKLKSNILACISKRAAENIREEINFMGPLKLSEVEAAQAEIIDVVRQLEADGEIELDEIRQDSSR